MNCKNVLTMSLFAPLALFNTACANDLSRIGSFRTTAETFLFNRGPQEISVALEPTMNAWSVNCDKNRAVVWGRAWDELNIGETPYSRVYLINLDLAEVVTNFTVTRGPYEVVFSEDNRLVSVDETILDQSSGDVVGTTEEIRMKPESCSSFPGKQSE